MSKVRYMFRRRQPKGASLMLIIGLAIVLGFMGVSAFCIMRLMAGGEQMQRAADSGNLTLARAELDQFQVVIPSSGVQLQFNGASDHTGGGNGVIDLRNINSVMGAVAARESECLRHIAKRH